MIYIKERKGCNNGYGCDCDKLHIVNCKNEMTIIEIGWSRGNKKALATIIPTKLWNKLRTEKTAAQRIPISLFDVDYPMLESIRGNDSISFKIPSILQSDNGTILENGPYHGFVAVEPSSGKAIYTPNSGYIGKDNFYFCVVNVTNVYSILN